MIVNVVSDGADLGGSHRLLDRRPNRGLNFENHLYRIQSDSLVF